MKGVGLFEGGTLLLSGAEGKTYKVYYSMIKALRFVGKHVSRSVENKTVPSSSHFDQVLCSDYFAGHALPVHLRKRTLSPCFFLLRQA